MDLSTYWAFWQRHKNKSGQLLLLLTVAVGSWYLGQITSPYYQASPIVFEDKSCGRVGGSSDDLNALAVTKQTDTSPTPASDIDKKIDLVPPASSAALVATPQISGSQNLLSGDKKFVGSINSDLFHDPTCPAGKRIKEANQIWFASVEEAQRAGYTPSKCTQEKLGL